MKHQVIYKIQNHVTNKFYVGSTINTKERFRCHRNRLRNNRHHCQHLQSAWNKYGEIAFSFVIVEIVPEGESLQAAEDRWLAEWVGKPECYNKGTFSTAPWRGVPKEQHPNFGKVSSEEERERISNTLKAYYSKDIRNHPRFGKPHSEETKAKIRQNRKGKSKGENHYRYGKSLSEEVRKKIGDTQRGVKKEPRVYTEEGLAKARENMLRNAKKPIPSELAAVIAKFPESVQDKYDFSEAVYTGALSRITNCKCPKHGVFSQYAARFRKDCGCPMCGTEQRAESKRKQMLECWSTGEGKTLFNRKKPKT